MLNSSDFTFESYQDERVINRPGFTVGMSGSLLMARQKSTRQKFLVKHTYPHNAANEYVACWLAERIGAPAPKAYLLSPNRAFKTKYAVAVEYIEGLHGFQKDNVPEKLKSELITQFALCIVLQLDDMIQLSRTDAHIYSYDFSEGFNIVDLSYVVRMNEDSAIAFLRPKLQIFRQLTEKENFDIPGLAKEFHLDPDDMKRSMINATIRAASITDEELDALTDELMEMYPVAIAVYYEECIRAIRAKAISLSEPDHNNEEQTLRRL